MSPNDLVMGEKKKRWIQKVYKYRRYINDSMGNRTMRQVQTELGLFAVLWVIFYMNGSILNVRTSACPLHFFFFLFFSCKVGNNFEVRLGVNLNIKYWEGI